MGVDKNLHTFVMVIGTLQIHYLAKSEVSGEVVMKYNISMIVC